MISNLVLLISLSSSAQAQPAADLAELLKQNNVVDQSIAITRQKIKDNRDLSVLPDLYMTLADFQTQKASTSFAVKRAKNPKTPINELDSTTEKRLREEAIETYALVITRFNTYRDLDKAYFFTAQEYAEINQPPKALEAYKKLTDLFPKSPLWEAAQFAIGNFYFEKKDFEFAIKIFKQILDRPENAYTSLAHFRTGWCLINQGKWPQALGQFENVFLAKSTVISAKVPSLGLESDVQEEALLASIWPLLELNAEQLAKSPEHNNPIEYYRLHSEDDTTYLKALTRLSRRLEIKKRHREAANALYLALQITADPEQKVPLLEEFYTLDRDQNLALWPNDYPQQISQAFTYADAATLKRYEPLVRDVVTHLQVLSRETKRPEDIDQAVLGYETYFFLYPRSAKGPELQVNYAEALFNAHQFVRAAIQYETVAHITKADKKALIHSALQAYIEGLKSNDKLSRLDRLQGQIGFEKLSQEFIKQYRNDPTLPVVEFNLGKLYFDKRDFENARKKLRAYVNKYPNREETEQAALLLLDSFYQENDLKNLVKEGDGLLAHARLTAQLKHTVHDMVETAKLRRVRALAGDFGSKQYSENLLQMAQSATDKSVSESALYEAFLSAKSRKDPQTYAIGETFLARFPTASKATSIDLDLIQMALHSADFRLAARYMEGYQSRHPNDPEASSYLSQAEAIFAQLNSVPDLTRITLKTGNSEKLAHALFLEQRWSELAKAASQAHGVQGTYYQGMAFYRMGNTAQALNLLNRAASSTAATAEEQEQVAHARYIVALTELQRVRAQWKPMVMTPVILKNSLSQIQEVQHLLQNVLELQQGRWVVGSLYLLGELQLSFAQFLNQVQPPPGLSAEQLQKALASQLKNAQTQAQSAFQQCLKVANEKAILTSFSHGCQSPQGPLLAESAEFPAPSSTANVNHGQFRNLNQAVAAASDDVTAWYKLAEALFTAHAYEDCALVLMRLLENKNHEAHAWAALGIIRLHLGEVDQAEAAFKKAKEVDANEPLARYAFDRLSAHFALTLARRPANVPPHSIWTHPWLN